MQNTKNSIPEKVRTQIVGLIQDQLAEAIDLTTQIKHAHWNVKGPDFIALHELFDRIAEESEEYSDLIAERIVQFGGFAEGTLQAAVKRSKLPEYPLRASSGKEHIAAVSHSLASFGESMRKVIDQANEVKDAATADIFTEIARGVDKNLWLLEAHTRSDF